jgi:hypothetical protein
MNMLAAYAPTQQDSLPGRCASQVGEFKLQLSNIRVAQFNASSDEARFQIQMEEFTLWITQVLFVRLQTLICMCIHGPGPGPSKAHQCHSNPQCRPAFSVPLSNTG